MSDQPDSSHCPKREFVTPDSALDFRRLLLSLPADVNKKLSIYDLRRMCQNYNSIPCPNCYGGHQRPCQWCSDSGSVIFIPVADLPAPSVVDGHSVLPALSKPEDQNWTGIPDSEVCHCGNLLSKHDELLGCNNPRPLSPVPVPVSRSGFGEVHGPTRPRIHNKKMLEAIEAVIIEHSGNNLLAKSVRSFISAEPTERISEIIEIDEHGRVYDPLGQMSSGVPIHDSGAPLVPVSPTEEKEELGIPGAGLAATHVLQNAVFVKAVDPGHEYRLPSFDGELFQTLTFMKREGKGFHGNVGHYPGTNLQSVLRACLDRVVYLQRQIPHENNIAIMCHLRHCLRELEQRAAERHGFNVNKVTLELSSTGAMCGTCGHVLCWHSVIHGNDKHLAAPVIPTPSPSSAAPETALGEEEIAREASAELWQACSLSPYEHEKAKQIILAAIQRAKACQSIEQPKKLGEKET